jgi:hypothetical protein
MNGTDYEHEILNSLVEIHTQTGYRYSSRVEECHGFHTFIDQEIISEEVISVILKVNGSEIDITNRLTKEELKLLYIEYSEAEKIDEWENID